jgi:hypothetical protein
MGGETCEFNYSVVLDASSILLARETELEGKRVKSSQQLSRETTHLFKQQLTHHLAFVLYVLCTSILCEINVLTPLCLHHYH